MSPHRKFYDRSNTIFPRYRDTISRIYKLSIYKEHLSNGNTDVFTSNEWISSVKLRESKLHTVAFYTRAMRLARMRLSGWSGTISTGIGLVSFGSQGLLWKHASNYRSSTVIILSFNFFLFFLFFFLFFFFLSSFFLFFPAVESANRESNSNPIRSVVISNMYDTKSRDVFTREILRN